MANITQLTGWKWIFLRVSVKERNARTFFFKLNYYFNRKVTRNHPRAAADKVVFQIGKTRFHSHDSVELLSRTCFLSNRWNCLKSVSLRSATIVNSGDSVRSPSIVIIVAAARKTRFPLAGQVQSEARPRHSINCVPGRGTVWPITIITGDVFVWTESDPVDHLMDHENLVNATADLRPPEANCESLFIRSLIIDEHRGEKKKTPKNDY